MNFKEILQEAADSADILLSDLQLEQFEIYYNLLIEWNEKINITAITEPKDVAMKHFVDCICLFKYAQIPNGASVIDVGTGGGFPGMVMKIYRPDLKVTLLDSLNKRLIFLKEVNDKLGFDVVLTHKRAEDGGHDILLRHKFDVAVSRAVAQLNILSEYCLPFVKTGGYFYALKGKQGEDEVKNSSTAFSKLGAKLVGADSFVLPSGESRVIVKVAKTAKTNDIYPRAFAKIKAKPL